VVNSGETAYNLITSIVQNEASTNPIQISGNAKQCKSGIDELTCEATIPLQQNREV